MARKQASAKPTIDTTGETVTPSPDSIRVAAPAGGIISLDEVRIVDWYARKDALEKELAPLAKKARAAALLKAQSGTLVLHGTSGVVTMRRKAGGTRLNADKLRAALGSIVDSFLETGMPTWEIVFTARSPAE
jgi:hypothetical protein